MITESDIAYYHWYHALADSVSFSRKLKDRTHKNCHKLHSILSDNIAVETSQMEEIDKDMANYHGKHWAVRCLHHISQSKNVMDVSMETVWNGLTRVYAGEECVTAIRFMAGGECFEIRRVTK
jgi:hypothetical protein